MMARLCTLLRNAAHKSLEIPPRESALLRFQKGGESGKKTGHCLTYPRGVKGLEPEPAFDAFAIFCHAPPGQQGQFACEPRGILARRGTEAGFVKGAGGSERGECGEGRESSWEHFGGGEGREGWEDGMRDSGGMVEVWLGSQPTDRLSELNYRVS